MISSSRYSSSSSTHCYHRLVKPYPLSDPLLVYSLQTQPADPVSHKLKCKAPYSQTQLTALPGTQINGYKLSFPSTCQDVNSTVHVTRSLSADGCWGGEFPNCQLTQLITQIRKQMSDAVQLLLSQSGTYMHKRTLCIIAGMFFDNTHTESKHQSTIPPCCCNIQRSGYRTLCDLVSKKEI